jgi:hypothetical protein
MCVFTGVFAKKGVYLWCFCGENVVDCMVDVVFWQPVFRAQKMRQVWGSYFRLFPFWE